MNNIVTDVLIHTLKILYKKDGGVGLSNQRRLLEPVSTDRLISSKRVGISKSAPGGPTWSGDRHYAAAAAMTKCRSQPSHRPG
jgi:hypothetical protein